MGLRNEKELTKKIKQLEKERESLREQRDKVRKVKMWTCPSCKKRTQLKNLGVLHGMYYEEPYGCTGGDYWAADGDYYVTCPRCNKEARYYKLKSTWGKREEKSNDDFRFIKKYYDYFGKKGRKYCRYGRLDEIEWDEDRKRKEQEMWSID